MNSPLKHSILALFLFVVSCFHGQHLKGVITNLEGQPLPFATVYIKNSTYGVAANSYGEYFIELQSGSHQLVFSYVGYSALEREINITKASQILKSLTGSLVLVCFNCKSSSFNCFLHPYDDHE